MEKRLRRKEERERMGTGALVDSQTGVLAMSTQDLYNYKARGRIGNQVRDNR
jgi:hypothetical protein